MDIDGDISRRDFAKIAGLSGIAAAGGAASTAVSIGDWLSEGSSGAAGGGTGSKDSSPVYLDRNAYQEAREEALETTGVSTIFSDEVYEDMFDGEDRDIIAAYVDTDPSEDKTDSSFRYFFVQNIDDYMVENDNGEEVFDYSQLGEEDLRMDSTSWTNISDTTSRVFEEYGTRNRDEIPDMLEGGLE